MSQILSCPGNLESHTHRKTLEKSAYPRQVTASCNFAKRVRLPLWNARPPADHQSAPVMNHRHYSVIKSYIIQADNALLHYSSRQHYICRSLITSVILTLPCSGIYYVTSASLSQCHNKLFLLAHGQAATDFRCYAEGQNTVCGRKCRQATSRTILQLDSNMHLAVNAKHSADSGHYDRSLYSNKQPRQQT